MNILACVLLIGSLAVVSCQLVDYQEGDINDSPNEQLVDSLLERWLENKQESNEDEESEDSSIEKRQHDDSSPYYFYDVNSHLPANDPEASWSLSSPTGSGEPVGEQSIRGPVNEPQEWEAKMGQLTAELNQRLPVDSPVRQALLMSLMNNNSNEDSLSSLNDYMMMAKLNELQSVEDWPTDNQEGDDSPSTESHGSEYIGEPLALFGHQLVQGGAGEGRQLLGPEGTFENVQVIKTDSAIPSYCDPPNPCPLGYSARDGCLEQFVNSASFSREYQAKQKCSCDNEHSLFNCASPQLPGNGVVAKPTQAEAEVESDDQDEQLSSLVASNKLDTLARTISNRFGDLASVRKLIDDQQARESHSLDDDESYVRTARKWSPEMNHLTSKKQLHD